MILSVQRFLKKNAKEGLGFVMLAALVLGIVSVPVAFRKTESDLWALQVNGKAVSYTRFMREVFQYKEFIASIKSTYGQFANYILSSMGISEHPEQIAIDKLIRQEILDQIGATINIQPHRDYMSSKIKDPKFIRNFISEASLQPDGSLDMEKLRKELAYYGLSISEFEQELSQGIVRDFVINLLDMSFYVPRFDVSYIYKLRHAMRDIMILEFPYEKVLEHAKRTPISDDQAYNYFQIRNRSSNQYWSSERREGVVFKIDRSSYDTIVTEQEIERYYEQNKLKKYIKTPVKIVVQKITNADFEKQFSNTEFSSATIRENVAQYDALWLDVEAFSRGTYEEAFERAAFGLKQPGDISPIVNLKDGTSVVLRLVRYFAREFIPFSLVRDSILKELQISGFKKQFAADANDLIKQGVVNRFADRSGVTKSFISHLSSDEGDAIKSELFAIKNVDEFAIYVDKEYGYIIQLSRIEPSVLQEFSQVKQLVLEDMYADAARNDMGVILSSAQNMINTKGITYLVEQYGAKIIFEGVIDPTNENEMKEVEKNGIYSDLLAFFDKKGMAYALRTEPAGVLLYIKDIIPKDDNNQESIEKELLEIVKEKISRATSALVASFYRNATIEVNELIRGNRSDE